MFGQPFDRGFWSDLRHTRHVVDGVADQGEVVENLRRRDAKFFFDSSNVERFHRHGVFQNDVLGHQLR